MQVKQISVFVENKAGGLAEITDTLAKADINLRALSISETSDFGILRLIVDDSFAAANILKENGFIYSLTDVIAVSIPDQPGGLASVVRILSDNGFNVEYAYAFTTSKVDRAYIVIRVEDNEGAIKALKENGITPLYHTELM